MNQNINEDIHNCIVEVYNALYRQQLPPKEIKMQIEEAGMLFYYLKRTYNFKSNELSHIIAFSYNCHNNLPTMGAREQFIIGVVFSYKEEYSLENIAEKDPYIELERRIDKFHGDDNIPPHFKTEYARSGIIEHMKDSYLFEEEKILRRE